MIKSYSTNRMSFHLRWKEDIGGVGLFEAVVEALQKGGVLKEAGVLTIEGDSPDILGSSLVLITDPDEEIHTETIPAVITYEETETNEQEPQI